MALQTEGQFGPNTKEVDALLEQVKNLTPTRALRLNTALWNRAFESAFNAAMQAGREVERNAASSAAFSAAWEAQLAQDATWDEAWVEAMSDARGAAENAALAITVRDLITDEQFNALYGLWASVMEEA